MRKFEFNDGKSAKFWNINLDGSSHTVTYGRIGTDGQSKTKEFDSPAKAESSYLKLIGQKEKKGYQEVSSSAVATLTEPKEEAPAEPGTCRLELVEGSSAKFWAISVDGKSHTVTYGRIGTDGQSKTKDFATPEEAKTSAEKLTQKKLKKGYLRVSEAAEVVAESPPAKAEPEPRKSTPAPSKSTPAPAQAPPTIDFESHVIWEDFPWDEVYPSRSSQHKNTTFPAATEIRMRFKPSSTLAKAWIGERWEIAIPDELHSKLNIAGPLDLEIEKELFKARPGSLPLLTDMWVAAEGPRFAVELAFANGCPRALDVLRLREHLAVASESAYKEAMEYALERRSSPKCTRDERRILATLFPDQDGFLIGGDAGYWLLTSLKEASDVDKVISAVGKLRDYDKTVVPYLPTVVDRLGVDAGEAIQKLIASFRGKVSRKMGIKFLRRIVSPSVVQYFVELINDKSLRELAVSYLKEHSEISIPVLKSLGTTAARQISEDLERSSQLATVEEAPADSVPEILMNPPWANKGKPLRVELPELELELLDCERKVFWEPGQREELTVRARALRKSNGEKYAKKLARTEFERLQPEARLEMWNELPEDFDERTSLYQWVDTMFSEFALEALPGALKMLERSRVATDFWHVDSPKPALGIASQYRTTNRGPEHRKMTQWYERFPRAGAFGVLPAALDPEHPKSELARYAIDEFFKENEEQLTVLREVAGELGEKALAGLESLLTGKDADVKGLELPEYPERYTLGTQYRGYALQSRARRYREFEQEDLAMSDRFGPEEGLKSWLEPRAEFGKFAPRSGAIADLRLAEFGLEAVLPGHILYAQKGAVACLEKICAPEIAPYMASHTDTNDSAGKIARRWLWSNRPTAIVGLLPTALGADTPLREPARKALLNLQACGERDAILEAADRYEVRDEMETLLDHDPLQLFPEKLTKMPKFWDAEELPPPHLKSGGSLPVQAVQHLGEMLKFSDPFTKYAGLQIVRDACEPKSLGAFAWELMQRWLGSGGSAKNYWALRALVHLGDEDEIRRLATEIRLWQSGKQKARANLGLEVLGLNGSDLALLHLSRYAVRAASTELRETAQFELKLVAARRGLSADELADRSVPRLGMADDGSLTIDLGNRTLSVGFNEHLKPRLKDKDGWLKRFPKAGKDDDAARVKAAAKEWKALCEDMESVATTELARLERAMCKERRWNSADFLRFMALHPLVRQLSKRLVWGCYKEDKVVSTFRVCEDGTLADSNDDAYKLEDDASVGILHPARTEIPARWNDVFADYEILQPFEQLGRPVHRATAGGQTSEQFKGLQVPASSLFGLCRKDWQLQESSLTFYGFQKHLSNGILEICFEPGLPVEIGPRGETQAFEELVVRGAVNLEELDPLEFSEAILELEALRPST